MPGMLWRGRLSLPTKLMVDANCVLAWLLGTTRDRAAMKRRVQVGYDGGCTDAVAHYDDTGLGHFTRVSEVLLTGVEVAGRSVLDVGCGTGIASLLAVDRGAARVVGGDLADASRPTS
jgi:ribosomal protein L11 methylase PrmA